MNIKSKYLEKAVDQMASLPGVGRKTALRLVLDLLNRNPQEVLAFSESFVQMSHNIKLCKTCYNLSDQNECDICLNPTRDHGLICVVRDIRDVMAIENTMQYKGVYHVLGGVISPMDGIGPSDLRIDELMERLNDDTHEIILAFGATMEGDTTNFFINKKLKNTSLKISVLSRGVSVGDELEYTDETTLGRSIVNRLPFESSIGKQ